LVPRGTESPSATIDSVFDVDVDVDVDVGFDVDVDFDVDAEHAVATQTSAASPAIPMPRRADDFTPKSSHADRLDHPRHDPTASAALIVANV
jgi:hypothetical protein